MHDLVSLRDHMSATFRNSEVLSLTARLGDGVVVQVRREAVPRLVQEQSKANKQTNEA